jgi:hypothetical protein
MGARRRKNLIASRRRTDDDGEEDGSIAAELDDDSSSLGSAPSEADNEADADGEGSDTSDTPGSRRKELKRNNGVHHVTASSGNGVEELHTTKISKFDATNADTIAMMNGLPITDDTTETVAVNFDDGIQQPSQYEDKIESVAEKRKREHEEYKKKRDQDPSFVPNRGGFFMHDQRSALTGQNGFRSAGRARGRGRGGIGGPPLK